MANTFISTDPNSKKQKTVKIPDGCIIIEMGVKEMKQFVLETFSGFLFVDEKKRLQVFPKEVKSINGIWRYVYPIRRGVAAIMVNEEKWNNLIKYKTQKKEKEERECLSAKDLGERRQALKEAQILKTIADGDLLRGIIGEYYKHKKNNNQPTKNKIRFYDIIFDTLDKYDIDITSLLGENSNTRNHREEEMEIIGHIPISESDKESLLLFSITLLKGVITTPKVKKAGEYYNESVNSVNSRILRLLISIYKAVGDKESILKTLIDIINKEPTEEAYSQLMYFYIAERDENNLLSIANKAKKAHPRIVYRNLMGFYYDNEKKLLEIAREAKKYPDITYEYLIDYYKTINDTTNESKYICEYLDIFPNERSRFYKRLIELGEIEGKIISPISHMNPASIKKSGSYEEAQQAEIINDYYKAADIYEALILIGDNGTEPYKRLMSIYRKFRMLDDEIRIIKLGLKKYKSSNLKVVDEWEKRLKISEKMQNNVSSKY